MKVSVVLSPRFLITVVAVTFSVLVVSCGRGSSAAAVSDSTLVSLGEAAFPYVAQYGYYGVCGVDGDTSACPFSDKLVQRLRETSATLCRCQDPSPTREVSVDAAPTRGVVHVSLYGGTVSYDLVVISEGGRFVIDDEQCSGQGAASSIYATITSCNHLQ